MELLEVFRYAFSSGASRGRTTAGFGQDAVGPSRSSREGLVSCTLELPA